MSDKEQRVREKEIERSNSGGEIPKNPRIAEGAYKREWQSIALSPADNAINVILEFVFRRLTRHHEIAHKNLSPLILLRAVIKKKKKKKY